MGHSYHPNLEGYDPGNVLHDGCDECQRRASDPARGYLELDASNQLQLWQDMKRVRFGKQSGPVGRDLSDHDGSMMDHLYLLAVFLERVGLRPDDIENRLKQRVAQDV